MIKIDLKDFNINFNEILPRGAAVTRSRLTARGDTELSLFSEGLAMGHLNRRLAKVRTIYGALMVLQNFGEGFSIENEEGEFRLGKDVTRTHRLVDSAGYKRGLFHKEN